MNSTKQRNENVIKVENLRKSFGKLQALDNVSLDIKQGQVTAIVGDNGAGKSTFIKILSGAYFADGGTIYFEDSQVRFKSPREARELGIETLYQDLALVEEESVWRNIFLGREELRGGVLRALNVLDYETMRKRAWELIEKLDIDIDSIDTPVMNLSGGQRQAVALARAILQDVRVLILDEPMSALGVEEEQKTIEVIKSLKNEGLAIIIISHNLDHVFSISDRVAVFKQGQLVGIRHTKESDKGEIARLILLGKQA